MGSIVARKRAQVIATYGDVCHICQRPGADSPDHVRPRSRWGTDDLSNLRPSHKACNRRRGDGPCRGWTPDLYVVTGPPAAGKSSYVHQHARPSAIVVDLDLLLVALAGPGVDQPDDADPQVRPVAVAARDAAIRAALRAGNDVTVWIVHAVPTTEQLATYRGLGATVVNLGPGGVNLGPRRAGPDPDRPGVAAWQATQTPPALPGAVSARFRTPQMEGTP